MTLLEAVSGCHSECSHQYIHITVTQAFRSMSPKTPPPAIVEKKMFSVSVRTNSCVNHMQIPCWAICPQLQDYREDKK